MDKFTKLLDALHDEEHTFHQYLDMVKDCTDERRKITLKKIACEEAEHFRMLYEMLFSSVSTDLEKAIKERYSCTQKHMKQEVEKN